MRRTKTEASEVLFEDLDPKEIRKKSVAGITVGIAECDGNMVATEYKIDGKMTNELASEMVNTLLRDYTITLEHMGPLTLKQKKY